MKRKLSLVMAFMMAATLVPANVNAASKNAVNRAVSVTSTYTLTTESTLTVQPDGVATPDIEGEFQLELGEGAEWDYSTTGEMVGNAKVTKLTSTLLKVESTDKKTVKIPMKVKLDGAPAGDQKVKVLSKDSTVTAGEYTYARVGESSVKIRVDKKVKISRGSEQAVNFLVEELTKDGLKANSKVTLKLPSGFTWKANNERSITIDVAGDNTKLDTVAKELVVVPSRKAPFGDVDVTVTAENANITPGSLVIAEYVDYGTTVKAEKVLDVIAGQDIAGKYKAKLTLEETAPASLSQNRYVEFTFVDENGKAVKASLQNDQVLKLSRKASTTVVAIDESSIAGEGKANNTDTAATYTVKTAKSDTQKDTKKANQFDLHVKSVDSSTRAKFEIDVPFVVDSGFTGKLFLQVKGAGIAEQSVQIAEVKAPVTIEVKGALPQVKIGLQKQVGSDIIVKETEAGALQDSTTENKNKVKYTIETTEKDFGMTFKSGKVEVTEGNISIDDSGKDKKYLYVEVDRKSTVASTLTFKDITVTLDRTVPYGEIKLDGNFGVVGEKHDLSNTVKSFEYFTTVTPVSQDKRITTVFTIDQKGYSEVNGNVREDKTADVAPFIQNNRTMLPVRYIADAIGAQVNYDPATRVATFQKDQTVVSISIDKDVMYVNGSPIKLFAKPANVEGRIFLPLVNVAQAFGLKQGGTNPTIIWNAEAKTVTILPQDATSAEVEKAQSGKVLEGTVTEPVAATTETK